jgi:hypothetical protein
MRPDPITGAADTRVSWLRSTITERAAIEASSHATSPAGNGSGSVPSGVMTITPSPDSTLTSSVPVLGGNGVCLRCVASLVAAQDRRR